MAHESPPIASATAKTRGSDTASVGDVLDSFYNVRTCVLDLFEASDLDPTKTRELARDLGVNRGLAWRLSRIVRTEDTTSVAHDVPGKPSLIRFAQRCIELGADQSLIDQLIESVDQYEASIAACTGSRKTLAMLLANQTEKATQQDRERARRTLFEGACSVWGVQAQTRFVTVFLLPSKDEPDMVDAAHVTGYIGFRRLGKRPWPMSYEAVHDAQGNVVTIRKQPLDPRGYEEGQLQLLPDFCEPRHPEIEVEMNGDYKCFNLAAGPVGNQGITDCVFGSYLSNIYPRYSPDEPNQLETAGFMVLLQAPVERVMFDYFVHQDLESVGEPITHLLDRLTYPHMNREEFFDRQSIHIDETHRNIEQTAKGAFTPHISWYSKLLTFVSERIDEPLDAFNGTRFEMNYPPISTTLSRRITLARKGG